MEDIKDLANWKTVILWGDFVEITEPNERTIAIDTLMHRHLPMVTGEMARFTPNWPFKPDDQNEIEGIFYKIEITKFSGRFENYQGIEEKSQPYL